MAWTTKKPTVPGWYWWRDDQRSITLACYVEIGLKDSCVSFAYGDRYRMASEMTGEWAGPLEVPE